MAVFLIAKALELEPLNNKNGWTTYDTSTKENVTVVPVPRNVKCV